ncbi:MAG TPA: RDD family protein [Candidatus Binataceae bacterium]|nr:RDD family protein [Candidatus Binataceae bacterium]
MNQTSNDADSPVHSFLSPEAVRLDLPITGPAPRILAYGIDVAIMAAIAVFVLLVVITTLPIGVTIDKWIDSAVREAIQNAKAANQNHEALGGIEGLLIAILLLTEFVLETGYFIFWEMATNGRSPGKMLVGLRVVKQNGLPIDLRTSVVRNLMRIADILPANYLVGLISMLISASGQRLGDHVAGTIVVRLDRPESAYEISLPENSTAVSLTRDQRARVGPKELQLLRTTLRRTSGLPVDRSKLILAEVAETMRERLGLAELPDSDHGVFLRNLLATIERSSRTGAPQPDRSEELSEILAPGIRSSLGLTRQQLLQLGPREMQLIRGAIARASTLTEDKSNVLLAEVAETMRQRLELAKPHGSDHLGFLRDLLAAAERFAPPE